jgi:hypothetical protein
MPGRSTSKVGTRAELLLALSLYSGQGTYAILLGSGVSSAGGVLTGWNPPLDLLTTNFDRLLERVLEAEGIFPIVIGTPHALYQLDDR